MAKGEGGGALEQELRRLYPMDDGLGARAAAQRRGIAVRHVQQVEHRVAKRAVHGAIRVGIHGERTKPLRQPRAGIFAIAFLERPGLAEKSVRVFSSPIGLISRRRQHAPGQRIGSGDALLDIHAHRRVRYGAEPVSYTHLDVYKRQKSGMKQMQMRNSWSMNCWPPI